MSHLALYLLGSSRLERKGEQVPISRRKVMALLAYLAVTGHGHRRDALATLLWPEYDSSRARADLRRTLSVLNRTLGGEGIIADRESVELNPGLGLWLDVDAFQQKLAVCKTHNHPVTEVCRDCVELLEQVVTLYRDDFLVGFTLEDSVTFDEWQFFQTEGLRDDLARALARLVDWYSDQGEGSYERAITYARRWLALDPLHEAARRQLMILYAESGQRSAALRQYRQCIRVLEEELGVAPSGETTALYERIKAEREQVPQERVILSSKSKLPAFLSEDAVPTAAQESVFVARELELAHLAEYLDAIMAGQGQVAFVTGGPGRGKTALMREFAREAMASHPELLVVKGNCNAYAGVGDPYLPFRELLGMLTGDVESRWAAGSISRVNAQRLWTALPQTLPVLVHHGSFLIDNLVSGAEIVSRAELVASVSERSVKELRALVKGPRAVGLQQQAIFQQVTEVLGAVSHEHPLLIILDDLQWVDTGSIGMLFHLGRRLAGKRILLLCTYRPEEVAAGRDGERHPLEKVLSEYRRQYGDVWIDLRQADETTGHGFVDALLDTEMNRLDQDFRNALAARTEGHPLFTVELLRAMQARGDVVRGPDGAWVEGKEIRWELLPARVEAVIGERLDVLRAEQRDMLEVASVEGETFTAQVIAKVQDKDERVVLQSLSRDMATRHRLVRESEVVHIQEQYLIRYQFAHALFQDYLYHALSEGERRLLHGEVAIELEKVYCAKVDSIAAQLAHHFDYAGNVEKAIEYYFIAAEQARLAYAYDEVITYFTRILALLDGEKLEESGKKWRLDALYGLGKVYFNIGRIEKAVALLSQSYDLGKALNLTPRELVRIYYWLGEAFIWHNQPEEMTRLGQEGLALLGDDVESIEGALMSQHFVMGLDDEEMQIQTSLKTSQYIQCIPYAEELRAAYGHIQYAYRTIKNVTQALRWCDVLDERAECINDLRGQASAAFFRAETYYLTGDIHKAITSLIKVLNLFTRIGDPRHGGDTLWLLGLTLLSSGDVAQVEKYCQQWYEFIESTSFKRHQFHLNINLGLISLCQHRWVSAIDYYQKALSLSQDIKSHWMIGYSHYYLGRTYQALGNQGAAVQQFQQAIVSGKWFHHEIHYLATDLSGLEETCPNKEAFRTYCRRIRNEYLELNELPLSWWFLETADIRNMPQPYLQINFTTNFTSAWTWSDPFGDCSYAIKDGLVLQAANGRNLWHINLSAPRLLRVLPSTGDFEDTGFVIQTVCAPAYVDRPCMGGLIIWGEEENYLYVERGVIGKEDIIFRGCVDNEDFFIGRGRLYGVNTDERIYLRLECVGVKVCAYCSTNGENWYSAGCADFHFEDAVQVGLFATGQIERHIYHGAYPDGTAIRFESFQLWII